MANKFLTLNARIGNGIWLLELYHQTNLKVSNELGPPHLMPIRSVLSQACQAAITLPPGLDLSKHTGGEWDCIVWVTTGPTKVMSCQSVYDILLLITWFGSGCNCYLGGHTEKVSAAARVLCFMPNICG